MNTKLQLVDLDQAVEQKNTAEQAQAEAHADLVLVSDADLITQEDLNLAADLLRKVKDKFKELDGQRKSVVEPINSSVKTINGWFKPVLDILRNTEKVLKKKMAQATEEAFERRRVALQEAGEKSLAGDTAGATVLMQRAQGDELDAPKGVSFTHKYSYEILDMSAIPRQYLAVDDVAVMAHVKANKEKTNIPGIKVVVETGVVSRAK